jgi:predicted amidophosphoribosyltransferase
MNPKKLTGPWNKGYALDVHVSKSIFQGYNQFGHAEFETVRTELGEHLFKLKYRNTRASIEPIAIQVSEFITSQGWDINLIVPVPPSHAREHQPVFEIATRIGSLLGIPVCLDCITKQGTTTQVKNLSDKASRIKLLKDAFAVDKSCLQGKRILIFDDLYQSGATLEVVARDVLEKGSAEKVYALTITMARGKS